MKAINVLLAVLVFVGLFLGLTEVGLRLIGFGPPAINTEFDAKLGWRGIPGSVIENESDEFHAHIALDDLGLRDDFIGEDAPEASAAHAAHRVLFLGDSFVGGYTVDREHLFADLLEDAYEAEGRQVEVINAGLQGYSTDQQLVWLRENGARFAPDVVVLFPYENDIWWNGQPDYVGEPKPQFDAEGALLSGELPPRPQRSWFADTAIGRLPRLFDSPPTITSGDATVPVELASRFVEPPAEALEAERVTARLVADIARETEGLGAAFLVAPIPNKAHVRALAAGESPSNGPFDAARPHRVLSDAAVAAGAMTIDLVTPLVAASKDAPVYYDRDFHLNPRGNGAVAGALHAGFDLAAAVPALGEGATAAPPEAASVVVREGLPTWPLWYLGLVLALGTLYSRTYKDEPAAKAYLQVGALLAVIFTIAIGGGALLGMLPPTIGRVALAALVIGLLTFVVYKLGDRVGTIGELMKAFTLRGHWYLIPLLSVLLTVGSLLVVAASSPIVAPFIYTLF